MSWLKYGCNNFFFFYEISKNYYAFIYVMKETRCLSPNKGRPQQVGYGKLKQNQRPKKHKTDCKRPTIHSFIHFLLLSAFISFYDVVSPPLLLLLRLPFSVDRFVFTPYIKVKSTRSR